METAILEKPAASGTFENASPHLHEAIVISDDNSYYADYIFSCMNRSREAAETYENAAAMVANAEIKSFLSDMADLKRYESERIRRFCGNDAVLSRAFSRSFAIDQLISYLLDLDLKPINTMEEACRFALKNELDNLRIYERLADQETDIVTKKLLLFLLQLEKSHLQFIQNQMALAECESRQTQIFNFGASKGF